MLLSFRVSNFLSIKDEQEFSFINKSAVKLADGNKWDSSIGTLAGIFGANASGKSNVLEALDFMCTAVTSSYATWASRDSIPITPFALDPSHMQIPSLFEVVFQISGVRYQYGFRATSKKIVGEWLYAYVTHRRQVWFERDVSSDEIWYFGKSFSGRNRVISDLTGPTTLFLSAASANNHSMAGQVEHFFRAHMRFASPDDRPARISFTKEMSSNVGRWSAIVDLMKFADLGIGDARIRREQMDSEQRERIIRVYKALDMPTGEEEMNAIIDRAGDTVEFGHSAGHGKNLVYLPLDSESLGTRAWFALVGPIIRAINNGDTLIIDEIDASLHPHLTAEILRIFRDPQRNPKQAQLLFTSHDTTLLGGLLDEMELVRDQVWFTEKKSDGSTILYPLTDFSPRKTENLERGYLQGRYGAVPYLDRRLIREQTEDTDPDADHGHGINLSADQVGIRGSGL